MASTCTTGLVRRAFIYSVNNAGKCPRPVLILPIIYGIVYVKFRINYLIDIVLIQQQFTIAENRAEGPGLANPAAAARPREALTTALQAAWVWIAAQEAGNWFDHRGHRVA